MLANPAPLSELRNARRSFCQREWLWALLLIALVFAAYARVFNAGFIWDDDSHLTQNPCVVGPLGLKDIWTSTRAVYYPLVLTTFWILHKVVGLSPSPYHILNVLMHAGSAVLLWRVLQQLNVRGAWLGAALWALHPVMTQSVAWVTELKNTQSCLFYLLSIFWFLHWESCSRRPMGDARASHSEAATGKRGEGMKFEAAEIDDPGRWWRFRWALLFFVMAILSKPSTVMLPAVLALCIWWRRGRIQWRYIVVLVPFMLISALASAWTIWEQKIHAAASGPEWPQSWLERLIIAGRATWFYLGKLVWPHPLIFIYPRWKINSSQLIAYLPLLTALAGLAVLWLTRGKWKRPVSFAVAYYVISLFPVLGFFSVYFFRYSFVSDHFQYLASMGPLALAGAGITEGITVIGWKSFLQPVACGILLLLLGALTWRQSVIYTDLVTLYQDTLRKNPACWMVHNNLGTEFLRKGQTDKALIHFQKSLEIKPDHVEALANIGNVFLRQGRIDEAIVQYNKALEIAPDYASVHTNLGTALLDKGEVSESIEHYLKALQFRPDLAEAHHNLGCARAQQGKTEEAVRHYQKALEIKPSYPEAHYNLALALVLLGRRDEAAEHLTEALRIKPDYTEAKRELQMLGVPVSK